MPQAIDFNVNLHPMAYADDRSYPYGSVTSCGDEKVSGYRLLSCYAGHVTNKSLKRLPVTEKWIFTTPEGSDSVNRNYEYSRFNGPSGLFTRPSRVSVTTRSENNVLTLISEQSYQGYDSLGRVVDMTDASGIHMTARWDGTYNMLLTRT